MAINMARQSPQAMEKYIGNWISHWYISSFTVSIFDDIILFSRA